MLVAATSVVVLGAAIGLCQFRFLPMFAGLTLLVGYQLIGAWRLRQSDGCRKHLATNINIPSKGGVSRFG
jgi:hypothetical protein